MNLDGKLLIKNMKTKTNNIEIEYSEYHDALDKSLYDESWIQNLYKDKENIISFFKRLNETRYISFAANFIRNPDIKRVIVANNKNTLNNSIVEQILDAGKAKENKRKVEEIKSITNYYANITVALLNEYSNTTRDFINATIKPYPESIEDTWKPIKTFRLIRENDEMVIKITNKKVLVETFNDDIKNYFNQRNISRDLKRGYLSKDQISESCLKNIRRQLLNLKEVIIPTNFCSTNKNDNNYKIIYKGNQTVEYNNEEVSISGENIKVYQILEVS